MEVTNQPTAAAPPPENQASQAPATPSPKPGSREEALAVLNQVAAIPAAKDQESKLLDQTKVDEAKSATTDDDFSKKFAALSRQQKQLFMDQQKLKADRGEVDKYKQRQDLKKTNLIQYLQEEGVSVDDIVKAGLVDADAKPAPPTTDDRVAQLEAKIQAYEKQIEENKRLAEEQKNQSVVDNFRADMNSKIKADPVKYEAIIADEAYDRVWATIENHFKETQEVITWDAAADVVEAAIVKEAQKLIGLKKLSASPKTEPASQDMTPTKTAPTLTNQITPTSVSKDSSKLSDSERRKLALGML